MANWSVPPMWPQVPRRRKRFWNYPRPYRTGWRAWVPSWRVVVGTMLTGVSLGVGVVFAGYTSTVIPAAGADVGSQKTTVFYADKTVMGEFAALDRVNVTKAELPNWDLLTGTLVASEDQSFWTNSGVDPMGFVRAFVNNVTGGETQGGSTLTMQYVEQFYGSGRTYQDKLREVFLAYKVTQAQSKDEIIQGYLNVIFFGRDAYGIEAASQAYFEKPAAQLDYNQVAFLVGIIPSPNQWDGKKDPELSRKWSIGRWERSIAHMAEAGVITSEEAAAAVFPEPVPEKVGNSKQGYTGYLLDMVRSELVNKAGIPEEDLMTKGYKVYTTIDKRLMDAAQTTMALPPEANPLTRASLTSVDPATGAIRAVYGGTDYLAEGQQTNAATYALAQGGSTFKPFTLIGALEEGVSIRKTYDGNDDIVFEGYTQTPGGPDRAVTNFGDGNYGPSDLIKATAHSINTVYVALNKEIGPEKTADVGYRLGIPAETCIGDTCKPTIPNFLSNVLGTATVHNIDLAHAYATIASGGFERDPYIVQTVTDLKDVSTYEASVEDNQVVATDITTAATYAMTQVVEEGSGTPAQALQRPVAGKTGTSTANKSAWFAGYVPQLVTVVGLYQYNRDNPEDVNEPITPFGKWDAITGGSWPVEAWTAYMQIAMEGQDPLPFPEYQVPKASPSASPSPSVSPSAETVQVPADLVGKPIGQVRTALEQLGLRVRTEEQDSEENQGIVLAVQYAGQPVPPNAEITVTVSTGQSAAADTVVLPDVVGMTQADAERLLRSREYGNLTVALQAQPSDRPQGEVLAMNPGPGSEVEPTAIVTLTTSSGPADQPDPTTSPSPAPTPTDNGNGNGGGGGTGNG